MRKLATTLTLAGWIALVAASASALDAPHDTTNLPNVCTECHIGHTSYGPLLSGAVGDTINNLCFSCHFNGGPGPEVSIHQSNTTDGDYDFTTNCTDCHNPHGHKQPSYDNDGDTLPDAFLAASVRRQGCVGNFCPAGQHMNLAGTCVADETCVSNPCPNANYQCSVLGGKTICTCPTQFNATCDGCAPGYSGYPNCVADACAVDAAPCANGHGTCNETPGSCFGGCAPGEFNDPKNLGTCTPVATCGVGSCPGQAVCDDANGEIVCTCPANFSGVNCDACAPGYSGYPTCAIDACGAATDPCGNNHGTCVGSGPADCSPECPVAGEYNDTKNTGTCTVAADCAGTPCPGQGICDDANGELVCRCPVNYTGVNCDSCAPGYTNGGYPACGLETCLSSGVPCANNHGNCTGAGGDCSVACPGGEYNDPKNTGTCTPDGTCSTCGGNQACSTANGEDVCICPVEYNLNGGGCDGNGPNTCNPLGGFSGGACAADLCDAGNIGNRCGLGDCVNSPGDCNVACGGGEFNDPQNLGACTTIESCPNAACVGSETCNIIQDDLVCVCPLEYDDGAGCTGCNPAGGFSGGTCAADVCTGSPQRCGMGDCNATPGDCNTPCGGGEYNDPNNLGQCTPIGTCSTCQGVETCSTANGEDVCTCPVGFDDGAGCAAGSCLAGFNGAACDNDPCAAPGDVGNRCGFGTCASAGGAETEFQICSDAGNDSAQCGNVTCPNGGRSDPSGIGGQCLDRKANVTISQSFTTQSTTNTTFNVWIRLFKDTGVAVNYAGCTISGSTAGTFGFTMAGLGSGAYGAGCQSAADGDFCWALVNNSSITLNNGAHTFACGIDLNAGGNQDLGGFDGIIYTSDLAFVPTEGGPIVPTCNDDATFSSGTGCYNWGPNNYNSGAPVYTCTCDTGYQDGAGLCDACAPGYIERNGVCVDDPCNAPAPTDPCSGTGVCYADSNGAAVCDCPNQWYGNDCLSCNAPPSFTCSCDVGYGPPGVCDQCAAGYIERNGACVDDPCSPVDPCSGGGVCYADDTGAAVCDCAGQWYGNACDQCNAVGGPLCQCDSAAYTGANCDQCAVGYVELDSQCVLDPCNPNPCSGGGTCYMDSTGAAVCDCPGQWYGNACDQCALGGGPYTCTCNGGYGPDDDCSVCDPGFIEIGGECLDDPCLPNPCGGGGTCFVDTAGAAVCNCPGQYYGLACDQCALGGTLACGCDPEYVDDGECATCAAGFETVGGACVANPCAGNTCGGKGVCYLDSSGTPTCDCLGQFYGAACDQCAVGGPILCECNAGYVIDDQCSNCMPGFHAEDGQCVANGTGVCAAETCNGNGTCFADESGGTAAAECVCTGTFYGATCGNCDAGTGGFTTIVMEATSGPLSFADGNAGNGLGVCEGCHTQANHHRISGDDSPATHNPGQDCRTCHPHLNASGYGFQNAGGGDCLGCHGGGTGSRRAINTDFAMNFPHIGVSARGAPANQMTVFDCVVCHMEGQSDGTVNNAYHAFGPGPVDLRNMDTGGLAGSYTGANPEVMTSFCISCHDGDGANNAYIGSVNGNDADVTRNPANPFGAAVGSPMNVDAQFDPAGFSAHSISTLSDGTSGQKYTAAGQELLSSETTSTPAAAWVNPWWWTSTTECADCHLPSSGSTTNNAHGSQNNNWMLDTSSGADAVYVDTDLGTSNAVCFKCHDQATYQGGTADTRYPDHSKGAHMSGGDNAFGIGCINCHGGFTSGGIHGTNYTKTDDDGAGTYNTYRFTNGAALDWWSVTIGGKKGDTRTCSAMAGTGGNNLNCTQHTGQSYGVNFQ